MFSHSQISCGTVYEVPITSQHTNGARPSAVPLPISLLEPAFVSCLESGLHQSPALDCAVPDLVRHSERGELSSVHALLNAGADPNCADDFQLTALHGASKKGHLDLAKLLIRWGARVNARATLLKGETPLYYACKYGHADVVRLLLESGADLSISTKCGQAPMDIAHERKHRCVEAVIEEHAQREEEESSSLGEHVRAPSPTAVAVALELCYASKRAQANTIAVWDREFFIRA